MIRFALFQQVSQCVLGYWMACDTEQFVPHDYAVSVWAQKIRDSETLACQRMRYLGFGLTWIASKFDGYSPASTVAFTQSQLGNFSQDCQTQITADSTPSSSLELMIAKCLYWILVPLFQYISAMVLADTFQYFTHRAFHVNRWLYSELTPDCPFMADLTKFTQQNIFTQCTMIYMCLLPTAPSTIIHWRPSQ